MTSELNNITNLIKSKNEKVENICFIFYCSRLRCTFLSSPKLVYIRRTIYFCVIQQYSTQNNKEDKER